MIVDLFCSSHTAPISPTFGYIVCMFSWDDFDLKKLLKVDTNKKTPDRQNGVILFKFMFITFGKRIQTS